MENKLKVLIIIFGLINYVLAQETEASGEVLESSEYEVVPETCTCLRKSKIEGFDSKLVLGSCDCLLRLVSASESMNELTTYQVDIKRSRLEIGNSAYAHIEYVGRKRMAQITYTREMNNFKTLKIFAARIDNNGTRVWFWFDVLSLKNVCDDSFPEGTIEYIIYGILQKMIYNENGCDIPKGSVFKMPLSLNSYKMSFNKPVSCGSYTLDISFVDLDRDLVAEMWLTWTIPEGSNCLSNIEPL